MATTSPPTPPAAPPPPPPSGPPAPGPRVRAPRTGPVRIIAVGALALVVLIVAYLVFGGSSGANYKLIFAEADQLVRGDQVEVAGTPVGSVKDIDLTPDFKAEVTIHVNGSLVPLHVGTVAQVRVPSLTRVANRYIALSLGSEQQPRLPGWSDAPGERHARSDRSRCAVQHAEPEDAQGPAGIHPGHRRTVRRAGPQPAGLDRILPTGADLDRPLLLPADQATSRCSRTSSSKPRRP